MRFVVPVFLGDTITTGTTSAPWTGQAPRLYRSHVPESAG
jgi:hypothetical protein